MGFPATTTSRVAISLGLEALVSIVMVVAFWLLANAIGDPRIVLGAGIAVGVRRGLLRTNRTGDVVALTALAAAQWFAYVQTATPDGFFGVVIALIVSIVTYGVGYFVTRAAAQVYRQRRLKDSSQPAEASGRS